MMMMQRMVGLLRSPGIIHTHSRRRRRRDLHLHLHSRALSSKLFVGGISFRVDEDMLKKEFSAFGHVLDAKIIMDRESGRSRGFGFVTFGQQSEAEAAKAKMNNHLLDGRYIRVDLASNRPPAAPSTGNSSSSSSSSSVTNSLSGFSFGSNRGSRPPVVEDWGPLLSYGSSSSSQQKSTPPYEGASTNSAHINGVSGGVQVIGNTSQPNAVGSAATSAFDMVPGSSANSTSPLAMVTGEASASQGKHTTVHESSCSSNITEGSGTLGNESKYCSSSFSAAQTSNNSTGMEPSHTSARLDSGGMAADQVRGSDASSSTAHLVMPQTEGGGEQEKTDSGAATIQASQAVGLNASPGMQAVHKGSEEAIGSNCQPKPLRRVRKASQSTVIAEPGPTFKPKLTVESIPGFKGAPYDFGLSGMLSSLTEPAQEGGGKPQGGAFDINLCFDNLKEEDPESLQGYSIFSQRMLPPLDLPWETPEADNWSEVGKEPRRIEDSPYSPFSSDLKDDPEFWWDPYDFDPEAKVFKERELAEEAAAKAAEEAAKAAEEAAKAAGEAAKAAGDTTAKEPESEQTSGNPSSKEIEAEAASGNEPGVERPSVNVAAM